MAERPRLRLLVGNQGLDRESNLIAAQPETFADARNVHVRRGRLELRRGLAPLQDALASEDVIIGMHPMRSQGKVAVVAYRTSTGLAKLYLVASDGTGIIAMPHSTLNTVFDLSASLPVTTPRVIMADAYDKLFIAHDEPAYSKRKPTKVYDALANTLTTLSKDLDDVAGAADVYFRGVTTYLDYLVGWGYGTEKTADDKDRPEIVRVSKPGDPMSWDKQHYFLAGHRNDPVLLVAPCGAGLRALKGSSSYQISGYDRRTFAIREADAHYGIASARLGVSVGGVLYFWSQDGPRMASTDGPSVDLGLPLNLSEPTTEMAQYMATTSDAFAAYDPYRQEVLFHFDRWAFVLSLKNKESERWSFRQYGKRLFSASLSIPAEAPRAVTGGAPDTDPPLIYQQALTVNPLSITTSGFTLSWTNANAGTINWTEVVEIWLRNQTDNGSWYKHAEQSIGTNPTQDTDAVITSLLNDRTYEVALRTRNGVNYTYGYTSSNPADWPSVSRTTVLTFGGTLAAPTNFSVERGEPYPFGDPNMVYATWDSNGGSSFEVERVSGGSVAGSSGTGVAFNDGGAGGPWWVRAHATNWNSSPFSNSDNA